ncbi:hypothetical protein EJ06DRAFT_525594 [Trichodelitschia bisporula]|uniref:Uncharacterized protein n=1 Tax=Trichodelitschia bisporula TaxID=703511 RepID=A0A6G1I9R0_9PEZI|nr:hypothetical protein EJ06DRAFT_525594 [Trichodelitschia bisporula]
MAPHKINVLLTSFPGLGLPKTLALPVDSSTCIGELTDLISQRLPSTANNLILTTTSNKDVSARRPSEPITSLLSSPHDTMLPLRLSVPLCGGKGGFGSQLRAAGGRMSSRKKRNQGENTGSSRSLDGRRLRTVATAKALAEYMAVKPGLDQREKEDKRKRWQEVVETTERKQEEIKYGGKARLDGKWVEAKDEATEKTREAVLAALQTEDVKDSLAEKDSDASTNTSGDSDTGGSERTESNGKASGVQNTATTSRSFYGWDEDEMSDSSDEEKEAI